MFIIVIFFAEICEEKIHHSFVIKMTLTCQTETILPLLKRKIYGNNWQAKDLTRRIAGETKELDQEICWRVFERNWELYSLI